MPLPINGSVIHAVRVVDDQADRRLVVSGDLRELNVEPHPLDDRTEDMDTFVARVMDGAQAAISDHQLRQGNYAPCTGAELSKRCYAEGFPVVLVTRYSEVIEDLRPLRRWIPVLLHPNEADPERLEHALGVCYHDIRGEFVPERKPWPALVHVEYVDRDAGRAYATVPAWQPPEGGDEGLHLPLSMFPRAIRDGLRDDDRLHAQVNIGAGRHEDLFLTDFQRVERVTQVSVA